MKLLAPFVVILIGLGAVIWMDDPAAEADLVFVNHGEVFTLDPQRMSYLQDLRLAHALYEGLLRWDNFTFSHLPAAARAVPAVSADALTWTFVIRPDARWSNGDPVTAHDFIWSWRRAILPDTAADYSSMFFVIDGAEDFFRWRSGQTAGFCADPLDGETGSAEIEACLHRLNALLKADDLPPQIAMPSNLQRSMIINEMERMRRHAHRPGAERDAGLGTLGETRIWLDLLQQPNSRAAEAEWMWRRAEKHFEETVGLEALDAHTLRVRLRRPVAYFPDLLCFGVFFPIHRPTVEGWPEEVRTSEGWHTVQPPSRDDCRWVELSPTTGKLEQRHGWARPGQHVANGPYALEEWRYKRDLRLQRNPWYHSPERVKSDSVLALTIEDTSTAVMAFESGRVDWLADVSAEYQTDMLEQRERYVARHGKELGELIASGLEADEALAQLPEPEAGERRNIHLFPTFGTEFFSFNCRPRLDDGRENPFADARVRRAFAGSIDKNVIVEHVTRLNEPVLDTLIPPETIPGYQSPRGLGYDPRRARRELRDAGWIDRGDGTLRNSAGTRFPVVDLLYTTNVPQYKWICLELKAQWERELGVNIEMHPTETKFYKEDLKQGKFMIARGRWYGDYGDPMTFLELCRTNDGNNDRGYSSRRVDAMLEQAELERDPKKRMGILHECERFLFEEEVPMLVLHQLVQVYMYEPGRVRGLSRHPRLTQFLWQIEVDGS